MNERLEQQAEERAAQLQAFFVNSPDWLTLQRATPDGRIVYADINPTSEAAYGLARDQVVGRTVEEVGDELGADSLHYLSLEGVYEAVGVSREAHCDACFTGDYPLAGTEEAGGKYALELPLVGA